MTLTANIVDRRCRVQGNSLPALESEVDPPSNFRKARRGSPASGKDSAADFGTRLSDRTVRAGLNSRVEPVSTLAPFTLNAVSILARGSAQPKANCPDRTSQHRGRSTMSDSYNMSMRKFLKQVGVTSQQAIEAALRDRGEAGKSYVVKANVTIEELGLDHEITGTIVEND